MVNIPFSSTFSEPYPSAPKNLLETNFTRNKSLESLHQAPPNLGSSIVAYGTDKFHNTWNLNIIF